MGMRPPNILVAHQVDTPRFPFHEGAAGARNDQARSHSKAPGHHPKASGLPPRLVARKRGLRGRLPENPNPEVLERLVRSRNLLPRPDARACGRRGLMPPTGWGGVSGPDRAETRPLCGTCCSPHSHSPCAHHGDASHVPRTCSLASSQRTPATENSGSAHACVNSRRRVRTVSAQARAS